jgi:hypothetical protein
LDLGHQATDGEVEKFMEGKAFVSEQVELSDGLPLYKGQKPSLMMSLGTISLHPGALGEAPDDEIDRSVVTKPQEYAPKYAYTTGADEESGNIHRAVTGMLYEPLRFDRREIRLLRFSPDSENEDIMSLKLEIFPLDEAPGFTALSYAWGSPDHRTTVRCNGRTVLITESLYNALVRGLQWNQRLYFWADGICINQKDNAERSAQVKLMGEIYTRATRTAAYLGEPNDSLNGTAEHSAFALMNMLSRIWEHDQEHALRSEDDWNALQIPDHHSQQSRDVWISMLSLWTAPWFSRAWVLQEVVLAKEVYIFYGEAVSNLECLMRFWDLAQNHDAPPPLKYGSIADAEALVRNSNQLGTFKRLRDCKTDTKYRIRKSKDITTQSQQSFDECSPMPTPVTEQKKSFEPRSLLELLVLSRANGATDSRDKVYSLLGMVNDVKRGEIVPDYDAFNTTAKVYQRVAELYMSRGFGISILHHAGLPQRIEGLPTWVPDWSRKSYFPFTTSLYSCTPTIVHRIAISQGSSSITVRGAIVDSYSIPGMQCNFRSWDSTDYGRNDDDLLPDLPAIHSDEQMRRMLQMSSEMLMHVLLGPSYHTGEDIDTVLWQTLIANRGWSGGKPTNMDRSSYDAYVRSYPSSMSSENAELRSEDPELRQKSWPFETVMQDVHRGRRFGITACGHVGVFPGETRNGDFIVLLPGATMPFVLRKSGDDKYILVGDCYLHGVMEGELIHLDEGQEEVLEAEYTETDKDGKRYNVRMRPWARFTTDKTKEALQGIMDPEANGYAMFREFNIY